MALAIPLDQDTRPPMVVQGTHDFDRMRWASVRTFSGERMARTRRGQGLSQLTLAQRAGLPLSTIRKWEQGRAIPSAPRLALLASVLGVPMDDLFTDTDLEEGRS